MLNIDTEIEVTEDDVIDFILTYNLLDVKDTYIKVYRTLGAKEMGRLIWSIERRFIYE